MNRKDWRTVSIEDVDFDTAELTRLLIPTLHLRETKEQVSPAEYGARLVREAGSDCPWCCPSRTPSERSWTCRSTEGVIDPTFLTADKSLQRRIQCQPLLAWKALNVRQHKGLS
jgi:hypothetical protein